MRRIAHSVITPVSLSLWFPKAARCASAEEKADALLVTALDEVAWFLNLRGSDVSYNPVFLSYVLLTKEGATLYVDQQKVERPTLLTQSAASRKRAVTETCLSTASDICRACA